jgi:hypothetical protein
LDNGTKKDFGKDFLVTIGWSAVTSPYRRNPEPAASAASPLRLCAFAMKFSGL